MPEIQPNYTPEIGIALVDRKTTQKFFVDDKGKISNPQFGTVIDNGLVQSNFEFRMIPQSVSENLGCATPTSYRFMHSNSFFN